MNPNLSRAVEMFSQSLTGLKHSFSRTYHRSVFIRCVCDICLQKPSIFRANTSPTHFTGVHLSDHKLQTDFVFTSLWVSSFRCFVIGMLNSTDCILGVTTTSLATSSASHISWTHLSFSFFIWIDGLINHTRKHTVAVKVSKCVLCCLAVVLINMPSTYKNILSYIDKERTMRLAR